MSTLMSGPSSLDRVDDCCAVLIGSGDANFRLVDGEAVEKLRLAAEAKQGNGSTWLYGGQTVDLLNLRDSVTELLMHVGDRRSIGTDVSSEQLDGA